MPAAPAGVIAVCESDGSQYRPVSTEYKNLDFTSPTSATTQAMVTVTGLGLYRSISIYAALTGLSAGTLDIYLQYSPDGGTTWVDYAHFPQIAASAAVVYKAWAISRAGQLTTLTTVGKDLTPALAANTIIGGEWGDRLRAVAVTSSANAGTAQVIKLACTP